MRVHVDKYALTSIQAAIDAVNPTVDRHAVIEILPGDYYVDGLVMKPYVHLVGAARGAVALFGTVTLSDACYFEWIRFEASENAADWSLVGNNVNGVHLRNCSSLAGPQSGPFRPGKFLRIYGDSWMTVLLENLVVDYRGEEFAISLEGPATGAAINGDVTLDNVFLDAFGALAGGGCVNVKDIWNARASGRRWRTSGAGKCLNLERTAGVTGSVDFLVESMSFEFGAPSLYVGDDTILYAKHSSWDSAVVEGQLIQPSNPITG